MTTTDPCGSLTTRRGTLQEITCICERGWGALEGSQPGRLIIEEKTLGKGEGVMKGRCAGEITLALEESP